MVAHAGAGHMPRVEKPHEPMAAWMGRQESMQVAKSRPPAAATRDSGASGGDASESKNGRGGSGGWGWG